MSSVESATDLFAADLTKLRVVKRRTTLRDEAIHDYETTTTVFMARPSLERPARGYLKGKLSLADIAILILIFIEQGLTSHQTHYSSYWDGFYRSNDPTSSVTALKDDGS